MIVEGALCSKASYVVLVEASRIPGEGDEAAGRKAEEALSDVCMKCATACVLRLVLCRQLRVIVKRWAGPLLAPSAFH